MSIAPSKLQEQQERWNEIVRDPALRDLPYKVETNARGQLLVSPHSNRHSDLQEAVSDPLTGSPHSSCSRSWTRNERRALRSSSISA